MDTNENNPKNAKIFICENCNFKCSKPSNYNKHILTAKHKRQIIDKEKNAASIAKCFDCKCGKTYKHMSSLCNHKKNCHYKEEPIVEEKMDLQKMFLETLKQNQELQKQLMEMAKEKNTIIQNTTNR